MEGNRKDKAERERMLLKKLQADFDKVEIETNYAPATEDMPTDILRTLHEEYGFSSEDVMGEFYFYPMPGGAEDVHYFTGMITLLEELDGKHNAELSAAISRLNFYIGCGAFALDLEGDTLVYKLVTPFSVNLSEEEALAQMNIAAIHTVQLPERFTQILQNVAGGTVSVEEVYSLISQ